jgi:glycosyl transferase family 25
VLKLQILVISLVRSPDRRAKVVRELSGTHLTWSFLDAVDGSVFSPPRSEYDGQRVAKLLGFELTKNELGCFLSHKNAWRKCMEANCVTLIFEDDFLLKDDFQEALVLALEKFTSWDILRLQGLADCPYTVVVSFEDHKIVLNHADPVGATAYMVTPRAAGILLEKSDQIFEPVDHFLEHERFHGLKVHAILPYPVGIAGVKSTIADRPGRASVRGYGKFKRSMWRLVDRLISPNPWFRK